MNNARSLQQSLVSLIALKPQVPSVSHQHHSPYHFLPVLNSIQQFTLLLNCMSPTSHLNTRLANSAPLPVCPSPLASRPPSALPSVCFIPLLSNSPSPVEQHDAPLPAVSRGGASPNTSTPLALQLPSVGELLSPYAHCPTLHSSQAARSTAPLPVQSISEFDPSTSGGVSSSAARNLSTVPSSFPGMPLQPTSMTLPVSGLSQFASNLSQVPSVPPASATGDRLFTFTPQGTYNLISAMHI
jgi:hypothetical protein